MSRLFFALAASLAAATAAPALAAPAATVSTVVAYGDLDLSSPAGQARLEQRLSAAARAVCGTAANYDLRGRLAVRACRVSTLSGIVRPTASPVASGTR